MSRRVDPADGIQLGAQVDACIPRTAGAVVAIRVPRDLLALISDYANARGLSVNDVVRAGVERLVLGPEKDLDQ